MSPTPSRAEPIAAFVLTVLGMALTTWAAFTHAAHLVVPGATLVTGGAAWLGNALARRDVQLFPFYPSGERPSPNGSDSRSPAPSGNGQGEG
jgi:hypothetical protein